ncbi:S26 family signal peptidase [Brevundimonas lutea]|uniref:S26 family signal peptidase n=1 Tax=Brevundimonas lutea TaxID=2293980 RepID=UPI000F01ACEB|nr:S26 family signal peptidase [Brevundimonas lutea]
MTRVHKDRRRWTLPAVATVVLTGVGAAAQSAPDIALVNESPSVPRGLYLRDPAAVVRRGDMVAIPQPADARPYLASLGLPAEIRLLKRAAGVAGDPVCRIGDTVEIDGRRVVVLASDRRGADLIQWRGCRRLQPDEVFLLGDTPGSFDSRYFGPVRVSDLDGVFRETLTW